MRYGTLENGIMYPAPQVIRVGGRMVCNPGAEHYAELNVERAREGKSPYLPVVEEPPVCEAGYRVIPVGWEIRDGAIHCVYSVREKPVLPPPPRTFDKYLLVDALMEAGVWPAVKEWLQTVPNAYDRAVMAPDISEDEPLLADGIAAVKQLLGWTDEQVQAVLDASVKSY